MGKSRKSKKGVRSDPINGSQSNGDGDHGMEEAVTKSVLDTIAAQLQSVNPEDKICGCHSISNLCGQEEARRKIVELQFSRMCAPLIMEQDTDIVGAALECLYNLSCQGGDTVQHLVSQDVLTPLLALVTQFSIITDIKDKQKINQREKIIEDSFNLLWNLLQDSEQVLEVVAKSNILTKIIPFMSSKVGTNVRVACLSVLESVASDNDQCREMLRSQVQNIANMVTNSDNSHLVRINAVLLLMAVAQDTNNNEILSVILNCVDNTLSQDLKAITNEILTSPNKQKVDLCNQTLQSQVTALEVLTNLASPEGDNSEFIEGSDEEFDPDEEGMDDGEMIEMSGDLKMFIDMIIQRNIIGVICGLLTVDMNSLRGNDSCKQTLDLHEKLLIDGYLCLGNLVEHMTASQLGGGEAAKQLWLQFCAKLCDKPANSDLADAVGCAVRGLTSVICKPDSGVSFDNVGVGELDQLVSVFTHYSGQGTSNIRTSVVNILGSLGCVVARTIKDQNCAQIIAKLAVWILDDVVQDGSIRVALEGVDKFMDIFSEDDSDQMFAQHELLHKLKQVQGFIKSRLAKEKRNLQEEDLAVASTVKLNLQRFVSYKEKRMRKGV